MTYADITKAEQMLRYQPEVKMEEGIKRFVEWYKAQRA
jgi:UDP-glucuronate 4-epimerase